MKSIILTKTSMATGNVVSMVEFGTKKKGIEAFNETADSLGYENSSIDENSVRELHECGGIGHDYRLELEITK